METRPRRSGVAWCRDGDDDDPHADEPAIRGPWQPGNLPRTGEVNASGRYRAPQGWLLARGFTDPDHTRHLPSGLSLGHMLEPDWLLHVAHAMRHPARTEWVPSTHRAAGDRSWG